jgi:hypothetical protein
LLIGGRHRPDRADTHREWTSLPRADALPEEIGDLALHQKHVVTHERFGRDVGTLVDAIRLGRKAYRQTLAAKASAVRWPRWPLAVGTLVGLLLGSVFFVVPYYMGALSGRKEADAERTRQETIKRPAEAAAAKKEVKEGRTGGR